MSSNNNRKITYSFAINEAITQMMKKDSSVFVIGQGVKSPWYVGNTCKGLIKKFGEKRVIDTPVSENAMTGLAVGAAIAGMRPIIVHPRMDFMLYGADPIINQAANWNYIFGGKVSVPVVFWGIINRGGEQGAQHSQALHSLFSHIPGLKVVLPSCPYDAKGLMISAILDNNPVVFIDDRWLYQDEDFVPKDIYSVPIGKGIVKREGKDCTIVAISYLVKEAQEASQDLEKRNIFAQVIDLRTAKPLDKEIILESVKKTGRLIICDAGWKTGGLGAEISALIAESIPGFLKSKIQRVALPDAPAPTSSVLEKAYFPDKDAIIKAVNEAMK